MIVETDRGRCIGAGQCVLNAPDLFDQDEDEGLVLLLEPSPAPGQEAAARAAAVACPASVITLREG
ncbi:ferredoxin [Blastococcus sp. URHD0036]|uniref:ferredoxin n=1 Tax=Blastococcus sp. URHD0036 TaxID=1380356 RepID=UPI000495D40E|nr:ferredoxin [Blastococcus sp. URHD0036]